MLSKYIIHRICTYSVMWYNDLCGANYYNNFRNKNIRRTASYYYEQNTKYETFINL